ncbi:hypothetical protein A2634_01265 [Candidatus Amesbacteria bacterium RIFCSPHIGHO2_01_FULL_48_32]|uniref:Uncharacterized protein n=1 Tax=Candidatus Amesbacteria bacterium RIFCSPLOWO2_01_FULL_48_25 TaxID=1797259 RepID=A0A1F4ZBS5_9BACT|nr:MAG: hypothetical protein A2634_01265 [Candidatus Amesbacteria bacterium RIFCSPHIGHO2_01_FULL_48_32]OGD03671.1 MAG: hypothetical protein A2989_03250 [Candidatus Amesbacteria bacterium RIFCSPLOWO2_01_FULL_48_25]HJZ05980.1 hypothetical protein [Patescibacteria group bacterium]
MPIESGAAKDNIFTLVSKYTRTKKYIDADPRDPMGKALANQFQDELEYAFKHPRVLSGIGIISYLILKSLAKKPR